MGRLICYVKISGEFGTYLPTPLYEYNILVVLVSCMCTYVHNFRGCTIVYTLVHNHWYHFTYHVDDLDTLQKENMVDTNHYRMWAHCYVVG